LITGKKKQEATELERRPALSRKVDVELDAKAPGAPRLAAQGVSDHVDGEPASRQGEEGPRLPPETGEEVNRGTTTRNRAELAVEESAERFRLLVESVKDYAIFSLDLHGNVTSWNQGAARIKGYSAKEIVGKHFSVFYPPEDARARKPDALLKIAAAEGRVEDEGWRVRKDGSRFWADVVITMLPDETGNLTGFLKVTRDVTERRKADEALRQLSGRLLRLQDEERRRMARELHDSTAQTLAALSLNLALVKQRAGELDDPRAARALAESMELADQASREIRTFSYLLHPPMLDEAGLPQALRWYADGFANRTGIKVDVRVATDLRRLPADVETTLFRIAQECLTNIHRHSGSDTATIALRVESGRLILEVTDEGKGVPDDVIREGRGNPAALGVGIRGMRERVRQLGGRLDIKRGHPGTIVEVVLPFAGENP
jgi:PAS domain S-box-containing protein